MVMWEHLFMYHAAPGAAISAETESPGSFDPVKAPSTNGMSRTKALLSSTGRGAFFLGKTRKNGGRKRNVMGRIGRLPRIGKAWLRAGCGTG